MGLREQPTATSAPEDYPEAVHVDAVGIGLRAQDLGSGPAGGERRAAGGERRAHPVSDSSSPTPPAVRTRPDCRRTYSPAR